VTVGVQWVNTTRATDASQAAYFRGLLAGQRQETVSDLALSRARLRDCMAGGQVVGLRTMARMRSDVRELETKKRELDRLIGALDRRFSALWSRQG
jgi:ribosomal protein S14